MTAWQQQQLHYDGFGPHFYEDVLPSHSQFSTSYFSFEDKKANQGNEFIAFTIIAV